jgi:phosphomannomutase
MYARVHVGRDAPVGAALVASLLARTGRPLSELVAAAPRYAIVKAKAARGPALEPAYAALRARFPEAEVDVQDGLRLGWADRGLHVRPSNTEPVIRLIAGADARPRAPGGGKTTIMAASADPRTAACGDDPRRPPALGYRRYDSAGLR